MMTIISESLSTLPVVFFVRGRGLQEEQEPAEEDNSSPDYLGGMFKISIVLVSFFVALGVLYCVMPKVSSRQGQESLATNDDDEEGKEDKEERLQRQLQAFTTLLQPTTFVVACQDLFCLGGDKNNDSNKDLRDSRSLDPSTLYHTKKSSLQQHNDNDMDTESSSDEENQYETTSDTEESSSSSNNNNLHQQQRQEKEEDDDDDWNTGTMLRLPHQANANLHTTATDAPALPHEDSRYVPALCAICLTEYAPGDAVTWSKQQATQCCHIFHFDCIVHCFDHQQQHHPRHKKTMTLTCPLCRRPFVRMNMITPQTQKSQTTLLPNNTMAEIATTPDETTNTTTTMAEIATTPGETATTIMAEITTTPDDTTTPEDTTTMTEP